MWPQPSDLGRSRLLSGDNHISWTHRVRERSVGVCDYQVLDVSVKDHFKWTGTCSRKQNKTKKNRGEIKSRACPRKDILSSDSNNFRMDHRETWIVSTRKTRWIDSSKLFQAHTPTNASSPDAGCFTAHPQRQFSHGSAKESAYRKYRRKGFYLAIPNCLAGSRENPQGPPEAEAVLFAESSGSSGVRKGCSGQRPA